MAIPNPNPNIADGIKSDNKTYSSNKIESLIKTATELPIPEAGDAGKVLTVDDELGYELATIPAELPTPEAGDAGKVLAVNESEDGYKLEALADVAVSGSYNDLEDTPTIPEVPGSYSTGALTLSDLTWSASAGGAYYSPIDLDSSLPAGKSIIAVSISGWNNLRATDVIIPYIRTSRSVGLISNVNSFADTTSSMTLTVIYS